MKHCKLFNILILVSLRRVSASPGKAPADVCSPSTSCLSAELGAYVPDPNDCHRYFVCVSSPDGVVVPSDSSFQCPEDQYFDYERTQDCRFEGEDPCYEPCLNFDCVYDCSNAPAYPYFIADPVDCTKFLLCSSPTRFTEEKCSSDTPFFNGSICTPQDYTCCDACTPFCEEPNTETRDPNDCRKFYLCVEKGIPGESWRASCPDGQYFEADERTCVEEGSEKCRALCSPSSTTSTTTPMRTTTTADANP